MYRSEERPPVLDVGAMNNMCTLHPSSSNLPSFITRIFKKNGSKCYLKKYAAMA